MAALAAPADEGEDSETPADKGQESETTSQVAPDTGDESVHSTDDANDPATPAPSAGKTISYTDLDDGIRQLPCYARSLLKVTVPVTVMLASSRQSVDQILDFSPGSIIQFDKSCDDHLSLKIGEQTIAEGEAVKVGDKFGLWITAMKMPNERFWAITGKHIGNRVK